MPLFKANFGSGFVDAKPLVRNADNTGWQECEVYVRNVANTEWVLVRATQTPITISPQTSERYANPGETITEVFAASGATSGSWSFVSGGTGLTITNPNSLSCTVSGTRYENAYAVEYTVLEFTASDGRTATATLQWSWGTLG